MNERGSGEPVDTFQNGSASNSVTNSAGFSPHLAHPPHPPQHIGLEPQSFVPYSPFLDSSPANALPTPPPASNRNSELFDHYHNSGPFPLQHSNSHAHSHPRSHGELSPLMTNMFGAALTSSALTAADSITAESPGGAGGGGGSGSGGSGSGSSGGNKVIQKADRSCKKCRERRVRCDRQFPCCARCTKRREQCTYGTGVFVETVEEGSDAAKIAELESKVASLESQLKNASSSNQSSTSSRANFAPPPSQTPPSSSTSVPSLARESLAAVVAHAVTSGLTLDERNVLDRLLNEQDQSALYGGAGAGAGSTAAQRKEVGITNFLLDASTRACCTKLPGLHLLRDRLPYFKANLNSLEPPHRLAVVCMCAIGIRVYPASGLFGIQSVTSADGTPMPQLFRSVGLRRENICKTLSYIAMEGCWQLGILREKSYENLDALVGLVQYLIHEEGRPEDARFFVRELVGMYLDLRHEELSAGVPTKLNEANTTAIFLADGAVSSTCNKPSFITPVDLQDYFATGGLRVPDLVHMQLGEIIEEQLGTPLNRPGILNMLTSLCLYVFSCHRVFSQVSNPRRPSGSSILPFLRNLWSVLDQIHQAVQRLQQHLVNLSSAPSGYVDDPQAIDHAILLAVRADNSLVDLIMLIHVHLKDKYSESAFWPERDGDEELERMRTESSMRVFKCLKLLAFYCQLYLASQDKHNVFHLILRLELLPNWTSMVAARIGTPGGPISEEFETTQEELDWFRCALELACYYSSQASNRLAALQTARRDSSYSAPSPSISRDSASRASFEQHSSNSPALSTMNDFRSPSSSTSQLVRNAPQPQQHHQQHQPQQYDTPPTSSSTFYTSTSSSSSSATFVPTLPLQSHQPPLPLSQSSSVPLSSSYAPHPLPVDPQNNPSNTSNGLVVGEDFAMNESGANNNNNPELAPSTSTSSSNPNGFADGAGGDVTGGSTDAVKNAFRSLDWDDLSLTPAIGSGSDGSSVDGGGDSFKVRKNRMS